jgi:hypothetical protein
MLTMTLSQFFYLAAMIPGSTVDTPHTKHLDHRKFSRAMEDSSGSLPSPAPALPPIFRNRYWILRHGRSIPNERGLIVSSLVRNPSASDAVILPFPEPKRNHKSNPRIQLIHLSLRMLLPPVGEWHEAGVRAGPAGRRAGARRRRTAPKGTYRIGHNVSLGGSEYGMQW